jgi:hypothetical protein
MYTTRIEQEQQMQRATDCIRTFFQTVPASPRQAHLDSYRGDRAALKSFGLPTVKQLPEELLDRNYFHRYLAWCYDPSNSDLIKVFMQCKLESERLLQWAGMPPNSQVRVQHLNVMLPADSCIMLTR